MVMFFALGWVLSTASRLKGASESLAGGNGVRRCAGATHVSRDGLLRRALDPHLALVGVSHHRVELRQALLYGFNGLRRGRQP